MNGHMARKYDMITVFEDYYQSDLLKIIAILITLYHINQDKFYKVIPIIILMEILMAVHIGC